MIYFDNSATTKPSDKVIECVNRNLGDDMFGNPGSLHKLGTKADELYRGVISRTAELLGADKNEIYFTSCATEGANTAIFGYMRHNKRAGKTIISTRTEHKATLECLARLTQDGYNVIYIGVDREGKPKMDELANALSTSDCALMCFTLVNNETGSILPLEEILATKKRLSPNTCFYLDAVQALGKMEINLHKSGVDMCSFSGHKIHSLKGVGVLYVKNGCRIDPFILGGGQQSGMRSGTQSLMLADAFKTALEEAAETMQQSHETVTSICTYLRQELASRGCKILSPDDALPYVLNVAFDSFESETMLHSLEIYDIYVSTVSACSSKAKKVSYVLLESGVDRKIAANAVRLSFSRYNTLDEAKEFVSRVDEIYDKYLVRH